MKGDPFEIDQENDSVINPEKPPGPAVPVM
jgi:hypothetical protein